MQVTRGIFLRHSAVQNEKNQSQTALQIAWLSYRFLEGHASVTCVFRSREGTVVIVVHVHNHRACIREEYVVQKSYDVLSCLVRFYLKIVRRPPEEGHTGSCDLGFRTCNDVLTLREFVNQVNQTM